MNNFKCNYCNHEFTVSKYSISYAGGVITYKANNVLIECPECGKNDKIESIKSAENGLCTNFSRISFMSIEQKRKVLRQRANKHSKKQTEQTKHINQNFTGQNYKDLL